MTPSTNSSITASILSQPDTAALFPLCYTAIAPEDYFRTFQVCSLLTKVEGGIFFFNHSFIIQEKQDAS